ncbi:MAG: hypothetical protein R3B95_03065 [Nitrospirales bacterium]|nr:hypothetical protein [Nitrospirales bacterium]
MQDVPMADQLILTPDHMVVNNGGLNNFRLFAEWTKTILFFRGQEKENAHL